MANRQDIRDRRRKQKQRQRVVTMLIVVGVVFILAAVLMLPSITAAVTPVAEFVQPPLNPRPMANANAVGDPNAPVVILGFSDFGCSHCGVFAQTTGEEIIQNYVATGQVYFVYHSVGSLLGNPNSTATAEAAYCAGDQNKFWEYHDILFANQVDLFSNINKKLDKTFSAYAQSLEMDVDAFESCLSSNQYQDEIQQDLIDARQAGINSTPSFLINGELVVGHLPYQEFQALIEAKLAQAGP